MHPAAAAELVESGAAFVDLSSWHKIAVSGTDACAWLNDLVSADIGDLRDGRARRSLLLSPTGRIRAEFTVADQEGTLLLLQDPAQPKPVKDLLAPYVLSSDVVLEDRTSAFGLFAVPGSAAVPDVGTSVSAPSCTGAGVDLLCSMRDYDGVLASLAKTHTLADADMLEAWRIWAGIPRFGVDATEDDLPQEGGFGDAVAFDKGCYLGQEAVAKVRNLGHPRRALLHLEAAAPVRAGDRVRAGDEVVGGITGVTMRDGRWRVLARVRWQGKDIPLKTVGGVPLAAVTPPDTK